MHKLKQMKQAWFIRGPLMPSSQDMNQVYSVSQKNPPPLRTWHFFTNGWEFLLDFLRTYYMFLSSSDYKFLFNYIQLWRGYAILSVTT